MYEELRKIGLTEGESKVYLALSELGSSTVGPIVKKSKVAYSNIYEILNRLIQKGIVSYIVKEKTKYFQAASPKNLLEYLEKKEDEVQKQKNVFKKLLPQLESIQKETTKEKAEVFFGKKGLKTAYEKHFGDKKEENLFLYLHKKRFEEEADIFYYNILDFYASVPQRGIANEYARETPWFKDVKKIIKVKYVDFPFASQVEICGESVLLVSWEKPLVTILINSKDIANNFREYFNNTWKIAKS